MTAVLRIFTSSKVLIMFRSEDLTVNVFGQELKASNLGEEDGKYSLRNGHLRRRDFEGQLEKWMSFCVLFVWLENMA